MSQALKTYSKGAPFYNVWVLGHASGRLVWAKMP